MGYRFGFYPLDPLTFELAVGHRVLAMKPLTAGFPEIAIDPIDGL